VYQFEISLGSGHLGQAEAPHDNRIIGFNWLGILARKGSRWVEFGCHHLGRNRRPIYVF
jgi:hypothetical protein